MGASGVLALALCHRHTSNLPSLHCPSYAKLTSWFSLYQWRQHARTASSWSTVEETEPHLVQTPITNSVGTAFSGNWSVKISTENERAREKESMRVCVCTCVYMHMWEHIHKSVSEQVCKYVWVSTSARECKWERIFAILHTSSRKRDEKMHEIYKSSFLTWGASLFCPTLCLSSLGPPIFDSIL